MPPENHTLEHAEPPAHPPTFEGVPRIGRVLDLVGLLVFAAGGALFARAWLGFRSLRDVQPAPGAEPWAAIRVADGFWRLQKIGAGLMLAGAVVFVIAWWWARRVVRRRAAMVDMSSKHLPSAPLRPQP
jgi:hypothetical protein